MGAELGRIPGAKVSVTFSGEATGPAKVVDVKHPRLWFWENRLKLLLMVSLVCAFLLSLLEPSLGPLIRELFRHWCHRTGERYRQAAIPLSRLRAALSALWLTHPLPSPLVAKLRGDSCGFMMV